MAIKIKKDITVREDAGLGEGGVPTVAPKNLNSQEAQRYNEYLKGKATQGLLSASDKEWTDNYNKNRYEILKGKVTQGIQLTAAEQAESDFLINQGIEGFGNPATAGISKGTLTGTPTGSSTTYTAPDGKIFTDLNAYNIYIEDLKKIEKTAKGQSAYDLLFEQFNQYGMGALVTPLKDFIQEGLSSSEFTLRLRNTDAYKKRFAANAQRIAKGLSALNEAEYIGLEDQYQNIMRRYGLPASYYARGEMGRQEGFEKFLANDVSSAEVEDRILTAQSRVTNANPEVLAALKQFYPGIADGDILAYTLDPEKALTDIKRKVTAAEIGGAAIQAGLKTGMARAEQLGTYGVDKATAEKGYGAIGGGLQRGSQLASIYGEDPYTQTTAEEEIFNLQGAQGARKQRQKVTGLEQATFAGKTGVTSGALARDRAGAY
jgi:hypothetical protein